MNLDLFQQILTVIATVTLAFSGVLQAARYQMDFFGALVLAFVGSVGGGTLRDLLIGATPVFWAVDPSYIQIIIPTTILSIIALRFYTPPPKLYLVDIADAAGLALFAILGAQKALNYQLIEPVAVIMGVITGIAGGMIRDVLTPTIPFVMRSEMYASAAIIGVVAYTLGRSYLPETAAMVLGMGVIFSLRVAAIYWQIKVPIIKFRDKA